MTTVKESTMSKSVRQALRRARFDVCRVENPCEPGFPDIAFKTPDGLIGLLELKQRALPKRGATKIDLGLRPEQGAFKATWGSPGLVWTLALLGDSYILAPDGRVYLAYNDLMDTLLWPPISKKQMPDKLPRALQRTSLDYYASAVSAVQ